MDAYSQGFVKACQDRGVEPSRLGAYLSSVIPLGSPIYGAVKNPQAPWTGAAKGLLGDLVGKVGGGLGGGLTGQAVGAGGAGLASVAALLARKPALAAKLRAAMVPAAGIGGGAGAAAGYIAGGGEGTYRAVKSAASITEQLESENSKHPLAPKSLVDKLKHARGKRFMESDKGKAWAKKQPVSSWGY